MLDEPRARNNGKLTAAAAAKGRAVAEARAARTLERAKAPRVAPPAPSRAAAMPPNFRTLDRLSRALLARATQGISPVAVAETWADWALHLASAPGKRLELFQQAAMTMARFGAVVAQRRRSREARAAGRASRRRPEVFRSCMVAMAVQRPCARPSLDRGLVARGDEPRARARARSPGRSRLHDARAPRRRLAEQHPLAQPGDPRARRRRRAASTSMRGAANWLDDLDRMLAGKPPAGAEAFEVGRNVAADARQGRLSQRPDGADPVRADDGQGVCRSRS